MKLLDGNSRQVQYARAFDRIAGVYGKLWLVIFLTLAINIAAAMALRFWPSATRAAGIESPVEKLRPAEKAESTLPEILPTPTPPPLTMPADAPGEVVEETAADTDKPPVTDAKVVEKTLEIEAEKLATPVRNASDEGAETANIPAKMPGKVESTALKETPAPPAPPATPDPIKTEDGTDRGDDTARIAEEDLGVLVVELIGIALPLLRVAGLICALLLVGVLSLALHLALLGRLGGADRLTAALVWSMALACIMVPWSAAFSGFPLPSATMLPGEIVSATETVMAPAADWNSSVLYWARTVGYPALGLIICLAIEMQWLLGRRPLNDSLPQTDSDAEESAGRDAKQ